MRWKKQNKHNINSKKTRLKSFMKKIISTLLLVVVLFNFIFCGKVEATDKFQGSDSIKEDSISLKDQELLINEGRTEDKSGTIGDQNFVWTLLGGIFGTIAGILTAAVNLFPILLQTGMTAITGVEGFFTIEKAVFNEIGLFNINYFNFKNNYKIGYGSHQKEIQIQSDLIKNVKLSIGKFYIILRMIAMILSLLILIYVGIRMAISTVASEKAKYKSMLIAWVESIFILFMMQYIVSLIFMIGEIFSNIIYNMKCILNSGEVNFETKIINDLIGNITATGGWHYATNSILYWFLIFIQTKFFLSYFKRIITVGFLILIAPIVTITYPIDKIGDGKAQAFSVWFSELAVNVFIQPIHGLIYLVFMYTAGEIAKYSTLVALLFLLSLTKVEKVILQLFNLKNVISLRPVEEERKRKGK